MYDNKRKHYIQLDPRTKILLLLVSNIMLFSISVNYTLKMLPCLMAASNTIEELSAAAVTRGIENPAKKTSVTQLHFHLADGAILFGGVCFILITVI